MKKIYLIGLLLPIIFLNACASSSKGHQFSGNAVEEVQQATIGINKGDMPPDFTIITINNKQYKLSQFKGEKPVLLYFWASWCPFCRRDFSIVKNIYPKYSDKVAFLAIDLDTSENAQIIEQYKNALGLEGIDFAQGNGKVLSDYQITHTTTKYAVGRNGVILYKGSGVFNEQQWEVLFNALVSS